ncbi:glycerate kinase [Embleya sp. NPDC050493]|uniref:glycerate kinase n=1 Tax=Embleya sp. NPDC050493 TaxID=3363989 RepID=UPI0037BE0DF5
MGPVVVVAPDGFEGTSAGKGALTAAQAALGIAAGIAAGIRLVRPDADVRRSPIADDGEGTVDAAGAGSPSGGAAPARLDRIERGDPAARPAGAEVVIASDVDHSLPGPKGAAAVYGPQKGAPPQDVREDVRVLDAAFAHRAARVELGADRVTRVDELVADAGGLPVRDRPSERAAQVHRVDSEDAS